MAKATKRWTTGSEGLGIGNWVQYERIVNFHAINIRSILDKFLFPVSYKVQP